MSLFLYLLNISGRPDRFFKDTRVKQEVLMKPVRSFPQVIEMSLFFLFLTLPKKGIEYLLKISGKPVRSFVIVN